MESEQSPLLPPRCTHSCQWSGYLLLCPVERDRKSEHKLMQELTVLLESKAAQLRPLTAAKKPAERNSDTQAARISPTWAASLRENLSSAAGTGSHTERGPSSSTPRRSARHLHWEGSPVTKGSWICHVLIWDASPPPLLPSAPHETQPRSGFFLLSLFREHHMGV